MSSFDYYMGIDVGISGGIAVLDKHMNVIEVVKTPTTIQDHLIYLEKWSDKSIMCCIENVRSQPQDGSAAAFTFGQAIGIMKTSLIGAGISSHPVTPRKWMDTYGMSKNKGESPTHWKNRLKAKAQSLFPKEKVTLWSADAYLIAEYCRRNFK